METQHKLKKIIIIPDVHGRDFWRNVVEKHQNDHTVQIIFLGDYLDSYPFEGFTENDTINNFIDIVFTARNANNITLLIGNHDLHYFPYYLGGWGCRRIEERKYEISDLFIQNRDLFNIAYETTINDRKYLFTHAGVLPEWLEALACPAKSKYDTKNSWLEYNTFDNHTLEWYKSIKPNAESLNQMLDHTAGLRALGVISIDRGGNASYGSCVWADVSEHFFGTTPVDENGKPIYQIFGHSLSAPTLDDCYILGDFAMLDCRKAFILDCTTGKITPFEE